MPRSAGSKGLAYLCMHAFNCFLQTTNKYSPTIVAYLKIEMGAGFFNPSMGFNLKFQEIIFLNALGNVPIRQKV